MSVSQSELNLILQNRGNPLVGLIHKETKVMVFALCIPQKVFLKIDEYGVAISGHRLSDELENIGCLDANELTNINSMLRKNYVPRFAICGCGNIKSAHEFLFQKKCNTSDPYEWGGFGVTLSDDNKLIYQFVSGAFNSPRGKRKRGAELSWDLIGDVINLNSLVTYEESRISIPQQIRYNTPPRRENKPLFFSSAMTKDEEENTFESSIISSNL